MSDTLIGFAFLLLGGLTVACIAAACDNMFSRGMRVALALASLAGCFGMLWAAPPF
jgi:hypothetical protein